MWEQSCSSAEFGDRCGDWKQTDNLDIHYFNSDGMEFEDA